MVDLTGNPSGPPKVPGGGPACSWGPPRVAGGITFRPIPPDFDINKAKATGSDIPPPVGKKDKGKKKIWQVWPENLAICVVHIDVIWFLCYFWICYFWISTDNMLQILTAILMLFE
jgi:hypothetical protein